MRVSSLICICLYGAGASSLAIDLQFSTVAETNLINGLSNAANSPATPDDTSAVISSILLKPQNGPNATPGSAQSALSALEAAMPNGTSSIADAANGIAELGLIPKDILLLLNGYFDSQLNSLQNSNPVLYQAIYSKKADDAPYSIPEKTLRAAIYIPANFSFGRDGKIPVLLVPGTAVPAWTTYYFSFSKLGDSAAVDVVWVNIPQAFLSNAQVNAEYVACAINYISALCADKKIAVITWSQGGLNPEWVLQYWLSTRDVV